MVHLLLHLLIVCYQHGSLIFLSRFKLHYSLCNPLQWPLISVKKKKKSISPKWSTCFPPPTSVPPWSQMPPFCSAASAWPLCYSWNMTREIHPWPLHWLFPLPGSLAHPLPSRHCSNVAFQTTPFKIAVVPPATQFFLILLYVFPSKYPYPIFCVTFYVYHLLLSPHF